MAIQNNLNITQQGIVAADGNGDFDGRTITAGVGITVLNGDGTGGNPTISGTATVPISFPTDVGTATPAANALTVTGGTGINTSGAGAAVTVNLDSPVIVANGGTGATSLTDGGIILGSGTAAVTVTAQPTNGQILMGSTGVDPVLNTLTDGTGIVITEGAGTITIDADAIVATSYPTDAGTAIPAANILTIAGGTGINTSGAGSTATINLDSPVVEANGGTNQTIYAKGDILYASAANTLAKLPIGADGEVLKVATDIPEWGASPGGSGIVYLATATAANSATLEFNALIDATYNTYLFVFEGIAPATNTVVAWWRTSTDGGATFDSGGGDYAYSMNLVRSTGTDSGTGASSGSKIILSGVSIDNSANCNLNGLLYMTNVSAGNFTSFNTQFYTQNLTSGFYKIAGGGMRKATTDVDAVQFLFGVGNVASGTIKMYGMTTPA